MTNNELKNLSHEIDDELVRLLDDYEINPLSFCAIVLARTLLLVKRFGAEEDFKKLVTTVIKENNEISRMQ